MTDPQARLTAALAGRYRVERELGRGGMATVYLARDLRHNRGVAVKVLRPDIAGAIGADRFLREIEIAAQLSHPHILPLYDSGEADGLLYYVMPFVAGESLRRRLARVKALLPADAVRNLVVGHPDALDERQVGLGLLDRVEPLALDVLDQRELHHLAVADLADHGRDAGEAGRPRGPQAALAGDELVAVVSRPAHDHRLEHTGRLDRCSQLRDRRLVEPGTRLEGVRRDVFDRQLAHAGLARLERGDGLPTGDQGLKPSSQHLPLHGRAPPAPAVGNILRQRNGDHRQR